MERKLQSALLSERVSEEDAEPDDTAGAAAAAATPMSVVERAKLLAERSSLGQFAAGHHAPPGLRRFQASSAEQSEGSSTGSDVVTPEIQLEKSVIQNQVGIVELEKQIRGDLN